MRPRKIFSQLIGIKTNQSNKNKLKSFNYRSARHVFYIKYSKKLDNNIAKFVTKCIKLIKRRHADTNTISGTNNHINFVISMLRKNAKKIN